MIYISFIGQKEKLTIFGKLGYEHKDDNDWSKFEDILLALDEIVKEGKIRYIGISNETAWGLSKFLEVSKLKDLPKMMCVQNPYNLLNRSYEVGLAEISIREESGLLAYSPLALDFCQVNIGMESYLPGSRMKLFGDQFPRYKTPNGLAAIEKYYEISEKYDLDMSQIALKFIEIQPFVTSLIIGATTMEQLKTNIESVNLNLTNEIIKEINVIQKKYPNPCP